MTKDEYIARLKGHLRAIETMALRHENELVGSQAALFHIRGLVKAALDAKIDSDHDDAYK